MFGIGELIPEKCNRVTSWLRIPPMPTLEASQETSKTLSKFGSRNTEASVILQLICSKAGVAAPVYLNSPFFYALYNWSHTTVEISNEPLMVSGKFVKTLNFSESSWNWPIKNGLNFGWIHL